MSDEQIEISPIDWMEWETTENGDVVYPLDKARAKYVVREIVPDCWLVLDHLPTDDNIWLHFAVLDFNRSDGDGKNVLADCIFHGEGPVGNLRECRHTYWGENGYVFYPNGKRIAAAFKALAEFYDDMA